VKTYEKNRDEFLDLKKNAERIAKEEAEKNKFTFEFKEKESDDELPKTNQTNGARMDEQEIKQKMDSGQASLLNAN